MAHSYNHAIRKIDLTNGAVTTVMGKARVNGFTDLPGTQARFESPAGVAISITRKIYVNDIGNSTIRVF